MTNKYDWGIYNGIGGLPYDRTEKEVNVRNQVLYMLNRSIGMFRYTGLPDTIKPMDLERLLQTNGFAVVTEVEGKLYAFYGGLGGMYNAYGLPTQAVIANPWLKYNATLKIENNEDAVLLRSDYMMQGLTPIFSKYLTMMNENEITLILAGFNRRVNHVLSVSDDNTADSARSYLKKIEDGELGFLTETKLFESVKTSQFGSTSGSINDLIEYQQYLKANMYNDIGLDANFNMKRERLNSAEVEMNSDMLYPLIDNMLECRREALDYINEKYGTEITVEFNSSWDYRINQGEPINTEGAGIGDLEQVEEERSSVPTHNEGVEEDEQSGEAGKSDSEGTGDGNASEGDNETSDETDGEASEQSDPDDGEQDEQTTNEDSNDVEDDNDPEDDNETKEDEEDKEKDK